MYLGAGMHQFGRNGLEAFRKAVVSDRSGKALEETMAQVAAAGEYAIGGESRKSVPRGYDATHPRARYLLFEGLNVNLERPIPVEAHSAGFVDYCLMHFKAMSPVNEWLTVVLEDITER
jgi:hypothetical protein